jgi:hypothetical protein
MMLVCPDEPAGNADRYVCQEFGHCPGCFSCCEQEAIGMANEMLGILGLLLCILAHLVAFIVKISKAMPWHELLPIGSVILSRQTPHRHGKERDT